MADGLPIADAARALGISVEAVRHRIRRGSLTATKSPDGRWLVHGLDAVHDVDPPRTVIVQDVEQDDERIIAVLHAEIDWLRAEIVRKDQLLGGLIQRVPQLMPPMESRPGWLGRLFGRRP